MLSKWSSTMTVVTLFFDWMMISAHKKQQANEGWRASRSTNAQTTTLSELEKRLLTCYCRLDNNNNDNEHDDDDDNDDDHDHNDGQQVAHIAKIIGCQWLTNSFARRLAGQLSELTGQGSVVAGHHHGHLLLTHSEPTPEQQPLSQKWSFKFSKESLG